MRKYTKRFLCDPVAELSVKHRNRSPLLVAVLLLGCLSIIKAAPGLADDESGDLSDSVREGPKIIEYNLPTKNSVPYGIGVDSKGRIWYTTQLTNQVGYFDPKTRQVKEFKIPSATSLATSDWKYDPVNKTTPKPEDIFDVSSVGSPGELIVDSKDRIWFVQVMGNSIGMFDPDTEKFTEYEVPTPNSQPYAIAEDSQGNIWFIERNANKIGKLEFSKKKIIEYALPKGRHRLSSIAIDKDQNIWITDIDDNSIGLFLPSEGKIKQHPIYEKLSQPQAAFAGSQGIWFTLAKGHRLAMLDPSSGNISFALIPGYKSVPQDIAEDSNGRIWYIDTMRNKVGYFDFNNTKFNEWNIPTRNAQPMQMVIDGNGDIWFTESSFGANKIAQLVISSLPKEGDHETEELHGHTEESESRVQKNKERSPILLLAFGVLAIFIVYLALKYLKK